MIADTSQAGQKRSWRTPPPVEALARRTRRLLDSRKSPNIHARDRCCGVQDVGWRIVSDDEMALAEKYFWGKRHMRPPSTDPGGIVPSVSDFDQECAILILKGRVKNGHAVAA